MRETPGYYALRRMALFKTLQFLLDDQAALMYISAHFTSGSNYIQNTPLKLAFILALPSGGRTVQHMSSSAPTVLCI